MFVCVCMCVCVHACVIIHLPLQVLPSLLRVYPNLQEQVKELVVSVHSWEQPPLLVLHSFTAVAIRINKAHVLLSESAIFI